MKIKMRGQDVKVSYGDKEALHGITLDIPEHQVIGRAHV